MTALLQKAFAAAETLSASEQDRMGQWILNDLEPQEREWDRAFATSQDQLARLADAALANFRAGNCRLMDEVLTAKHARTKKQALSQVLHEVAG
jgi:hypothetical protein